MKSLIIFSSMSGNTEELGNKMKEVLEKYNHEAVSYTHLTLPTTPYV